MRAPQYGHTKRKHRSNNAAVPADAPATGRLKPDAFSNSMTHGPGRVVGKPARARFATATPTALYYAPEGARGYRPQKHIQITMYTWHKSAMRNGELDMRRVGPVMTKPKSKR